METQPTGSVCAVQQSSLRSVVHVLLHEVERLLLVTDAPSARTDDLLERNRRLSILHSDAHLINKWEIRVMKDMLTYCNSNSELSIVSSVSRYRSKK